MRYTKEQILSAARLIKNVCNDSSSCYKCPFSDCEGGCILPDIGSVNLKECAEQEHTWKVTR